MNQQYYGIWQRILRIDLSQKTWSVEKPDFSVYRTYFGGRALALYYLLKEIPSGTDPLSAHNALILMTSPLTGYPISGQGRHTVASLSPLTGGLLDSQSGGHWGAELKHAGWDGIIIEGKSVEPVYLYIEDEHIQILSAQLLSGKTTGEVDAILRKNHPKKISILQNGPAGEHLVRYAAIACDLRNFAARGGGGAVMGSKNLRAIAVYGSHKHLQAADPEKFKELAKWHSSGRKTVPGLIKIHKLGTSMGVAPSSIAGNLPTYNQQDSTFAAAEEISGETMHELLGAGTETCYACAFACKRVVEGRRGQYQVTRQYGGPEYESIGTLGAQLGIDDIVAIAQANELCNALGIDTISAGVTIAWAIECFERGLISAKETGGTSLRWNDPDTLLKLLHQIAQREGFGDLLAEGCYRASQKLGNGTEKYAMHVKGQELPAHDPRGKWGVALQYGVSPTGADHMQAMHDSYFSKSKYIEQEEANGQWDHSPAGYLEPIDLEDLSPTKVRFFVYHQFYAALHDVLDWCLITTRPDAFHFGIEHFVNVIHYVTGWRTNAFELLKAGERAITMARAFNYKHGFTSKDDVLPERLHQGFREGTLKGHAVDKAEYEKALKLYYGMLGWDDQGVPTEAKLEELGIGWIKEHLG